MDKLRRFILVILALPAMLLSGCGGNGPAQTPEDGPAAKAEIETSPEAEPSGGTLSFICMDMEGNSVTEAVLTQSRLTMINVWATYCNPCLREMPGLGELAAEYDPEEFQIIGVVSDVMEGDDQELAESLIQETGADYPHLLLNESIYYALLADVTAVPTTFFLDGEGTVLDTVVGAMEKSAWEEKINGFLEG